LPRGDEDASERASWETIEECKQLNPLYHPTDWIGMVRRWGAAEAVRRLLVNGDIQYGFQREPSARPFGQALLRRPVVIMGGGWLALR
jgi:hypothetical protein